MIRFYKLVLCLGLLAATPAFAQTSPGQPQVAGEFPGQFQRQPRNITIALTRRHDLQPDQFVLRMSTQHPISGCPRASGLQHQVRFHGPYMDVNVMDFSLDMHNLPEAPQYDCPMSYQYPSAEIVLSRELLEHNRTSQIRFQSGDQTNYYDVRMNNQMVQLARAEETLPDRLIYRPMQVESVDNTLRHWFYPEGTLILSVPGAAPESNLRPALDRLARNHGLVPLESVLPGFRSPLLIPHSHYYVDKNGTVSNMQGIDRGAPLGELTVETQIYGLAGDEYVQRRLPVSARLPGTFE